MQRQPKNTDSLSDALSSWGVKNWGSTVIVKTSEYTWIRVWSSGPILWLRAGLRCTCSPYLMVFGPNHAPLDWDPSLISDMALEHLAIHNIFPLSHTRFEFAYFSIRFWKVYCFKHLLLPVLFPVYPVYLCMLVLHPLFDACKMLTIIRCFFCRCLS